jgi:hypothetical protein
MKHLNVLMKGLPEATRWLLLAIFVLVSGCEVFVPPPVYPTMDAESYKLSMMSGESFQGLSVTAKICSARYMDIRVDWPSSSNGSREIRIDKVWPAGVVHNELSKDLLLHATLEVRSEEGRRRVELRGIVRFSNLSVCQMQSAVLVASSDDSVVEPPIYFLMVNSPVHKDPWAPRVIIYNGYKERLNEFFTVVGPIPFQSSVNAPVNPVVLENGVPVAGADLRGATSTGLDGRLQMQLWLKSRHTHISISGNGDEGIFFSTNPHMKGVGILLPETHPVAIYPLGSYHFVLGGGLLVEGPLGIDGVIRFDREAGLFELRGHVNQAGSVIGDFRTNGHFQKGAHSRFGLDGEIDLSFDFNHQIIKLAMFPGRDGKTYWIGGLNENLLGMAIPEVSKD